MNISYGQLYLPIWNENQCVYTAGNAEVFFFFAMISSSKMYGYKLEASDHDNLAHG
jgi:hypothetical protein